jgi:hypothetical protein
MLKFRIIAIGKDFPESGRRSIICQTVTQDALGFSTLGRQFNWEIDKASLDDVMLAKLDELRITKTIIEREFSIVEVTRANPETGDIKIKSIAEAA